MRGERGISGRTIGRAPIHHHPRTMFVCSCAPVKQKETERAEQASESLGAADRGKGQCSTTHESGTTALRLSDTVNRA